jgi:UDP-N-acetylmuramyl-tripeptide synthetase
MSPVEGTFLKKAGWSLVELLGELLGETGEPLSRMEVSGIAYDSRKVQEGDVFFCMRGSSTDGHRFAGDAAARGARVVVADQEIALPHGVQLVRVTSPRRALARAAARLYGSPSRELLLVGVTGTNGKTTVSYQLQSILTASGRETGLLGTIEYRWGSERRIPRTTTPDPLEFQGALRSMVDLGCRAAVMEVSSHGIAQERIADAEFNVVVLTNISRDHLDFHGSFEEYRRTKARLFSEDAPFGENRIAVLNLDDPLGSELADLISLPRITYGISPMADVTVRVEEVRPEGTRIKLQMRGEEFAVRLNLPGRVNSLNAAAAAAAATAAGIGTTDICDGLEALEGVPGRLEAVREGQPFAVFVDYAHTPDALERLLAGVRELVSGPLTVVFGCGGDRDRGKRPLMGAIACRDADRIFVTNDNPRSESPQRIAEEILGGCGETGVEVVLDRAEAIGSALADCPANGAVVIAGKGHEDYQIIGSERRHFDDREVARQALHSIGFGSDS